MMINKKDNIYQRYYYIYDRVKMSRKYKKDIRSNHPNYHTNDPSKIEDILNNHVIVFINLISISDMYNNIFSTSTVLFHLTKVKIS